MRNLEIEENFEKLIGEIVKVIDYDIYKELNSKFLLEFPELEERINSWLDGFCQNPKDENALHLVRLIRLHYEKFPDIISETITRINERLDIKPFKKGVL